MKSLWSPDRYHLIDLLFPLFMFLLFFSSPTAAQESAGSEFQSISNSAVILYDAPSRNAEKLYVAGENLPVEVVVKVEGWVKVRDSHGYLAWAESGNLSPKRFVIVNTSVASVYQSSNPASPLVFRAQQDVILEWLGNAAGGWAKVRHQEGQTGYIRTDQIWGV